MRRRGGEESRVVSGNSAAKEAIPKTKAPRYVSTASVGDFTRSRKKMTLCKEEETLRLAGTGEATPARSPKESKQEGSKGKRENQSDGLSQVTILGILTTEKRMYLSVFLFETQELKER